MTARERLFAVLNGEPTDRLPIWLLFPYHYLGCYVDVRTHPGYREIFEYSKERVIMLNRRSIGVPLFEEGQAPEQKEKGWIRSDEELTDVLSRPILQDPTEIHALLDVQMPKYLQEKEEFPAHLGAMMLALGEPIGWLYHNADMQEFAIWSLTRRDEITAFLDRIYDQKKTVYEYFLERDAADVYFLVGSELAAPPMVSHETFREWIVPYAKGLIDLIHGYGKKAIQHFHGQIRTLLHDFVEMGADALHTIEAPPVGDCTFTEAFDVVGDRIALIGNIQYDEFRALTPAEMRDAVNAVIEECRGKRLILSPSAGPFDEKLSDRMKQNYLTFIRTGWEAGDWR